MIIIPDYHLLICTAASNVHTLSRNHNYESCKVHSVQIRKFKSRLQSTFCTNYDIQITNYEIQITI